MKFFTGASASVLGRRVGQGMIGPGARQIMHAGRGNRVKTFGRMIADNMTQGLWSEIAQERYMRRGSNEVKDKFHKGHTPPKASDTAKPMYLKVPLASKPIKFDKFEKIQPSINPANTMRLRPMTPREQEIETRKEKQRLSKALATADKNFDKVDKSIRALDARITKSDGRLNTVIRDFNRLQKQQARRLKDEQARDRREAERLRNQEKKILGHKTFNTFGNSGSPFKDSPLSQKENAQAMKMPSMRTILGGLAAALGFGGVAALTTWFFNARKQIGDRLKKDMVKRDKDLRAQRGPGALAGADYLAAKKSGQADKIAAAKEKLKLRGQYILEMGKRGVSNALAQKNFEKNWRPGMTLKDLTGKPSNRYVPPMKLGASSIVQQNQQRRDAQVDLYRMQIEQQKSRFLQFGQLPQGFEFAPGNMGRLGNPMAVAARGGMPIMGGGTPGSFAGAGQYTGRGSPYRGQSASRYHRTGTYGDNRSSFQSIAQNIEIPTEAGKFGVTSATREQLSRQQRKSVPGSRNISLDFNAYRQGSRGGMIVIPNDATEAEVKAAQQYIQGLRNIAKKHGLGDYKIHGKGQYGAGIKTRSENGRGVGGFFHTEPGFNTDPKFKKMMSDPKIRQDYIDMMSKTLGNIPGARFIAPHHTKGNQGAVMRLNDGRRMSETQLAREYLIPGLANIRSQRDAAERAKKFGSPVLPEKFGQKISLRGNKVDPTSQRNFLIKEISKSKLLGHVPKDGANYGIHTGSAEEWSNYFMRLGSVESSLTTTTHGDKGRFKSGSRGIYQLSVGDAARHGLNKGKDFTIGQLENPEINTRSAIKIHENLLLGNDKTPTKWKPRSTMRASVGRYWGPVQRGWTPGGTKRDRKLFEQYGQQWATQDAERARMSAKERVAAATKPNKIQSDVRSSITKAGRAFAPSNMDELPESVLNMRVKDKGKTTTLKDLGVKTFSDLNNRKGGNLGGQAFRGGRFGRSNDPNVTFMGGEIQKILGDKFGRITAQNDAFHHGSYANSYMSKHLKGNKLDFTINGNYTKQVNRLVKEMKDKYGLVEGRDYKINRNFNHGTGKHVDIGFTAAGRKRVEQHRAAQSKGSEPAPWAQAQAAMNHMRKSEGPLERPHTRAGEPIVVNPNTSLGAALGAADHLRKPTGPNTEEAYQERRRKRHDEIRRLRADAMPNTSEGMYEQDFSGETIVRGPHAPGDVRPAPHVPVGRAPKTRGKLPWGPPMKLGGPKPTPDPYAHVPAPVMGPGNITQEEINRRIAEDVPNPRPSPVLTSNPKTVAPPPDAAAKAAVASADVEAKADVAVKKGDAEREKSAGKEAESKGVPPAQTKGGHRSGSTAGRFPRNDPESQPASEGSDGYGSFGRCFV